MASSRLTYESYLKINELLSCQASITEVHDEHLFIIVHQAFELWFKQILHDVDSVRQILKNGVEKWRDIKYHTANNRLQRVVLVLRLVVEQFHILETMPPLNFVDFRDRLTGGSGFQSLQFRKMEKLLGVRDSSRKPYEGVDYKEKMDPKDKDILLEYAEWKNTLLDAVESWLSKTPGINDTNFWEEYKQNDKLSGLDDVLDKESFEKCLKNGDWQLSQNALKGALLITLHQDKAVFQQPYQLLTLLMDIDVGLMKWRSTHIHMVHRMIGQKVGTGTGGGSETCPGYNYLRSTYSDDYKIFRDLFKMATYLRPRVEIPDVMIPDE